jgi:hypothetical protein
MSEGTVSWFLGCHSIMHSYLVWRSWKILYGHYPSWWITVCILIHDIGHIGKNYLSDYEQKKEHWGWGACIAGAWFGKKGFHLVAGHDRYSGHPESGLYKPDKYSWYIAPDWWIEGNTIFEPKLKMNYPSAQEARIAFKAQVKKSIESGEYRPTHDLYLERCKVTK